MKNILVAAAVAVVASSGSAWAACSADIDMGGNNIMNAADPRDGQLQDVATKGYVDAAGKPSSCVHKSAAATYAAALEMCAQDNAWIPSLKEAQQAGCATIIDTWVGSHDGSLAAINTSVVKNDGTYVRPVAFGNAVYYHLKLSDNNKIDVIGSATGTAAYNCVK